MSELDRQAKVRSEFGITERYRAAIMEAIAILEQMPNTQAHKPALEVLCAAIESPVGNLSCWRAESRRHGQNSRQS